MKATWILSAALAFSGAVVATGALLIPTVAEAQQKIGPKVGVPLKAAQDAIQKKNWNLALNKIKEAQAVQPRSAYEDYKINELLWYVYLQQGRNADAARVLEQQMASGQMSANEKVQRTKTLAQLYFRAGNFGKAVQYGNQYLKSVPGDQDTQVLVSQAYFQQKDYKAAVAAADRILKSGQRPSEDLLQLVLRANYELKDEEGTAKALEQLLKYYPSPETWSRLLDGYIQETNHDHELLALYRLAEDVGTLTKSRQFLDMAQALYVSGFAIESERIMEQGLAANLFSGDELVRAQRTRDTAKRKADQDRKTLAGADKALASAKSGEEAYNLGKLYFSAAEYANAAAAMSKAVSMPGLADADDANMEMGMAYARLGKKAEAIKAFDAVKAPQFAEVARLWKLRLR